MSQPLVSTIIPAYNRPEATQRAIESVSNQVYAPIELVVVDDCSQPPLYDEVSIPESTFYNVVFKTHEDNQGGNAARNTGIENASGEYLAFLDSDDEWSPIKLRRQIDRLTDNNMHASYTGIKQVDSSENINTIQKATQSGDLLNKLLKGNLIGTFSSLVLEAKAVEQIGKPDPDMPCWQDWEWYLRLAAEDLRFDAITDPLTTRHNGGDQISRTYAPKRNEAYPIIRNQICDLASTPKQKQIALAYLDFNLGYSAMINNHYSEARDLFARAIRKYPKDIKFFIYLACSGPHYPMVKSIKRSTIRIIN